MISLSQEQLTDLGMECLQCVYAFFMGFPSNLLPNELFCVPAARKKALKIGIAIQHWFNQKSGLISGSYSNTLIASKVVHMFDKIPESPSEDPIPLKRIALRCALEPGSYDDNELVKYWGDLIDNMMTKLVEFWRSRA